MTWVMVFCAWAVKAGGCVTPTSYPSKAACEFVLRHQREVAKNEKGVAEWMAVSGRCIGIRP